MEFSRRRLAAGKACINCKQRKIRCDGAQPSCSCCQVREIHCRYLTNRRSRFHPSDGRISRRIPTATASANHSPRSSQTNVVTTLQSVVVDEEPVHDLMNLAPLSPPEAADAKTEESQDEGYMGQSSTFTFVSRVKDANSNANFTRTTSSVNSRRSGSNHSEFLLPHYDVNDYSLLPQRATADRLLDLYFTYIHKLYPFLHEPSFRTAYERIWQQEANGANDEHDVFDTSPPIWFGVLNLVFAFGCEFIGTDTSTSRLFPAASGFIERAKAIVFANLFRKGNLETVQTLLLMSHYLQGTPEINECWNLVGLMIRIAYGIGLHLDPTRFNVSFIESAMRKCVWWGCFVLDRTLSVRIGRPPAIRNDDSELEIELPMAVDDEFITDDELPQQPTGRPSYIHFFIRSIRLMRVMEGTLRNLYLITEKFQRHHSACEEMKDVSSILTHTVQLDGDVMAWNAGQPRHLVFEQPASEDIVLQRSRNTLRLRFLHLKMTIHRQALLLCCRGVTMNEFQRAIALVCSRECLAAARGIIALVREFHPRRLINSLSYNLHFVFSAMGVLCSLQIQIPQRALYSELADPSTDPDLIKWGMQFLRDARRTNPLAARFIHSLRQLYNQPQPQASQSQQSHSDAGNRPIHLDPRPELSQQRNNADMNLHTAVNMNADQTASLLDFSPEDFSGLLDTNGQYPIDANFMELENLLLGTGWTEY